MQYTLFGPTAMRVSRFCLGAMTFTNRLEPDGIGRVVDEAIEHGVNFIDTADAYSASEAQLGEHLTPEKRERVFLASKVYKRFCRDERLGRNSRTNILHNIERSLNLLKTDYLDLYQLHHPDPDTPVEETLGVMDTLVRQGKIRYWGVSNHYAWQMAYTLGLCRERRLEPLSSYQSAYSILDRQIEREAVPMLQRFQTALMCYSPLGRGILTGKYHPEGDEAGAQVRKRLKARIEDPTITEIVHELRAIAKDQALSINQLAVAWLLSKPWVTTVILGGSKPEHFSSIYEVADHELPEDVVQRIDRISEPRVLTPYSNQPETTGPPIRING